MKEERWVIVVTAHYYLGMYGDEVALIGIFETEALAQEAINKESDRSGLSQNCFNTKHVKINESYTLITDEKIKELKEESPDCPDYTMVIESWDYEPEVYLGGYVE